jgi:uncharacterized protein (DUF1501 family)
MKKSSNTKIDSVIERRNFLKGSGLMALTLTNPLVPWAFQALMNSSVAQAESSENAFVFIFLRGGADGLSILPPAPGHSERGAYEAARPNIKLNSADISLLGNTGFALNNACPSLLRLYEDQRASFYHGVGNKSSDSRSHFIQQDYVEYGGVGFQNDGFLNRILSYNSTSQVALAASSAGAAVSKALLGNRASPNNLIVPVQSLDSSNPSEVSISNGILSRLTNLFVGMGLAERLTATWNQAPGSMGEKGVQASQILNQTMENVRDLRLGDYGKFTEFKTAAQLLIGCPSLRFLTIDVDGWDTHNVMGPQRGGYFYNLLSSFDLALGAFLKDLEGKRDNVRVVIVSEFGRPLQENGTLGLDHGRGGIAISIGPKGEGGRVYSQGWSLRPDKLADGRDVAVTIDHRELLGNVLIKTDPSIENKLSTIFPKARDEKIDLNFKLA